MYVINTDLCLKKLSLHLTLPCIAELYFCTGTIAIKRLCIFGY